MLSSVRARVYLACGSIFAGPLMHAAVVDTRFVAPAILVCMSQAGLVAWLATARRPFESRPAARWLVSAAAGGAVLLAALWASRPSIGAISGLSHASLFLALLVLFGGSLRPGQTPVVTVIARAARGSLSPELIWYTRLVTVAWAGFAAAQLAISALLLAFAPHTVWSLFVNGLDMPAMLILGGGEYAYRRYRFRSLPRLSRAQFRRSVDAYFSVRGS